MLLIYTPGVVFLAYSNLCKVQFVQQTTICCLLNNTT